MVGFKFQIQSTEKVATKNMELSEKTVYKKVRSEFFNILILIFEAF